jgi:uroporphyrinogen-III synthase
MRNIKTVLITRPKDQAEILANKLRHLGFTPLIFPAVEIKSVNFDSKINLATFNKIIFVSPSAILNFHSQIKTLPAQVKIFTMGEDSARLVEELGWPTPFYPIKSFNRESLLHMSELQNITKESLLIITGKNRSPELETVLNSRGADITTLEVYERTLPHPKNLPHLNEIDLIICTSQESLKNLVTLLGPTLKTKTLLVSSQKLVDLAKILGFEEKPLLAQNAGDSAIIQALPTRT